jgi:ABC-type transport system involved in cytochrome c biogenesis permease subunit
VQNAAVLTAIEVTAKSKRDWYSYNELIGGRAKLASEAQRLHSIEAAKQTEVQRQTLKLASDFGTFEALAGTLAFTRHDYPTGASPLLRELFGDEQNASLSVILSKAAELRALTQEVMADNAEDFDAIQSLFAELGVALDAAAQGPALFPPPAGLEAAQSWWDISTVVDGAFTLEVDCQAQIELVAFFERLEAQKLQPAAFEAELVSLNEYARELAEARGEYGQIPLEVKLYRMDLFTNSLVLFLLGFILAAFGWVFPRARWLPRGVWALAILATSAVTLGIVLRCIIRQRPPVISLYDTILFITACGVLVTLLLEFLTRRRVALSLGCLFGVAGMFLAGRYELKEVSSAGDTMASVVAVLDTNYYLAIHVTTVTLGYVGGLVAGLFAHVWILGKLFGVARDDKSFYKTLSRMIYGVLCFCLFFAIFGTIMGGVWANDSWGRFWGWDPKENGALLICLWVLMTLHARMGGYARDRGMAVLAVLAGVVVSASWWGVNLLNVGLHSYGFTSGVARTLYAFWAVEGLVVLASGIDWLAHRHAEEPRKLAVGKEA